MHNSVARFVGLVIVIFTFCLSAIAQDVIISEFLASNPTLGPGIVDEDRERSDWIEIHNRGTNVVDLWNWSLTDQAGDPTKWRFPSTNIAPGQFIVVFASNKDRKSGTNLHTNFRLSANGGYLGLIRPDGSIASEFNPYPPQVPSVSFGPGAISVVATNITSNSQVRILIPTAATPANWATNTFSDSLWTLGTNGVGFGSTNAVTADYNLVVGPTAPVGFWRLNEPAGSTTVTNTGSGASLNGTAANVTLGTIPGPRPAQFAGFENNNSAAAFNGTSSSIATGAGLMNNLGAFTVAGWIRPSTTPGARIGLFGQNDCVEFGFINGTAMQCWTPGGGFVDATYPHPTLQWHHVAAVGNGQTIRIFVDGNQIASGGTPTTSYGTSASAFNIGGGGIFDATGNFFNGQIDEVVAYHRALTTNEIRSLYQGGLVPANASVLPYVRTDIGSMMSNINASAYIRIPFTVANPTNVALVTLRVRYDDGFAAFINGVEVARGNAPETLSYNSTATNAHTPAAVEEFRLGALNLVPGANVLAIQGLNLSAADTDFVIAAELITTSIAAESPTPLYFTVPTPRAVNAGGAPIVGPAILEPQHTPNVPTEDQNLLITARVSPTFNPVASVVMRYRIMFTNEIELTMFDDGLHGDGAAGDLVYGATIPASASTNGQMIRWYIRATDTANNLSRWPIFSAATQTEYLGTIVEPIGLTSKLPIIHLFAPPNILGPGPTTSQTAADSQTGSRGVSVFHDGEFYDNIEVQVRGNTTAGYNKKSHRFEFNADHPFRHGGPGPRIRRTSFVADYPDPTYMRQGLCYWLGDLIGCPSPFYIPHRLQLNGRFYQLANHNDVSGEEMLTRLGYDERGALYNAAGQVTPGRASTGGFEKRTRRWDNDADYDVIANAVSEARSLGQRRTNVFEMLDLPQVINYMVSARWAHENDDVWANMSLYHDNDGDNLWRIIPFDMNLSWGAIFYEGGNPQVIEGVQSTNDIHKAFPLYGSSQALALSGPGGGYNRVYDCIFLVPETREMYLRRLRSMLDTYVGPIGTPAGASIVEQKIIAWRNLIAEEATRDRAFWGWPAKGGQCNFDPGIAITNGVNQMLTNFVMARRNHFYGKHTVANTALPIGITKDRNAGIPFDQPLDAALQILGVEFNPSSSNQAHEFICITNPQPLAIDISDWKLIGGVDFTFKQGTVIPPNNVVYVSPDVRAFRARPATPRGNQGHFIVGPYSGQLSARGEGVALEDQFGRPVHSFNYTGVPSLAQQFLRVSEIMYNPAEPSSGPYIGEDFEFIELINTGPTALNLANVRFTEGIQFNFAGSAVTSLAPGQRVAVVRNTNAFLARYGAGLAVAGQFVGTLDSGGERIQLVDGSGENVLDFEYNNNWYPVTDGHGFSLILANQNADWSAFDDKATWRAGFQLHGTPAAPEPVVPGGPPPILITEVLTHTDPPLVDFVELHNPLSSPITIGGWFLTDDFINPKKYRIPAGTVIPAGGYLSFDEADFNPPPGTESSFSFSSFGDEVFLFSGDAQTNLAGYAYGFDFGDAENAVSFGRYVTSTGAEHFVPLASRTEAAANSAPKVGPVIISEIMYNPSANDDDSLDEFIELQNTSGAAVNLFDPAAPTNTWNLDEAVEFDFPQGTSIPAGGFLLAVNFSPTNTAQLNAFRARYGVPTTVAVVGPFSGRLANEGERLELRKPNPPETNGEVRYVIVERVDYGDSPPWPVAADGSGASLQRRVNTSYYNDPTNWVGALPSPGAAYVATTAPQITTQPVSQNVVAGNTLTLSVASSGSAPLSYQWTRRGEFIAGATNATLMITNLHPSQRGEYAATVFNTTGSAISSNAVINVLLPVRIFGHPGSVALRGSTNSATYGFTGSNVTFVVQATSSSGVAYQWRFNDVDIPGATNSSLMVSNATLANVGTYQARVTDAISSLLSAPATLTINIPPIIYQQPQSIEALAGDTVHFIAIVGGTGPMTNRWQKNGVNILPLVNAHVLSFTNVQPSDAAVYRLITSNPGNPTGVASANVPLTILADSDGDRMADIWETNNGFVVGTPDGAGDADNDGVKNSDEYGAGTNPRNAQDFLRVEDIAVGGGVQISFMAASNKTYTVQYKNDLSDPAWQRVTNVVARATTELETVTDQTGSTRRFYRLVTPYQP